MKQDDNDRFFRQKMQEQMNDDYFYFMADEEMHEEPGGRSSPSSNRPQRHSGDISTGAAVISTIGGLLAACALLALLGFDGNSTPVILVMILWLVLGLLISYLFRH